MLTVTKITEGGINLQTREQIPRSIVISNGHHEAEVTISDEELKSIVGLLSTNEAKPPAADHEVPAFEEPKLSIDNVISTASVSDFSDRGTGAMSL